MTVRDLRFALRTCAARYPRLYAVALRLLRSPRRDLLTTPDSHIVVDGFPRSGNTYAVCALMAASDTPLRIARHIHLPIQFQLAARYRIPAVLLLRDPVDAAVSLLIREPCRTPKAILRDYARFYRVLYALRQHMVVGHFSEIVHDPYTIYRLVNQRFETAFPTPPFTTNLDRAIRRLALGLARHDSSRRNSHISSAGIPNGEREGIKQNIRKHVLSHCPATLLNQAYQVYHVWRAT